ncbi:hypothetical protein D3C71_1391090 [compost metagenome]
MPADGVLLAKITVIRSTGAILNSDIADIRKWKSLSVIDGAAVFNSAVKMDYLDSASPDAKTITVAKPLKGNWVTSIIIPAGQSSVTWTHNLGLSQYAVTFSSNSPNRHVNWSNKQANSIVFNIDDVTDIPVTIDAIIAAF